MPTDAPSGLVDLATGIADTAFAFRGYNITNLGRTDELLNQQAYRSIIREELKRYGEVCSDVLNRQVDLLARVEQQIPSSLDNYSETLALIVAVEIAQIRLLTEIHGVEFHRSKLAMGYSLGELVALGCCGMFDPEQLLRVPIALSEDCAALAADVSMGVLFSRGPIINELDVLRLCIEITTGGQGTIGISSILSPNTFLLLGQGETIKQFKNNMPELLPHRAHLRINSHRWPPVHTPIVRHKHIPDRTAVMLEQVTGGNMPPYPAVLSLVTGTYEYDDHTARHLLRQWSDHPQRLWDCVYETLADGVETIIHVGPEPNLIPATYRRLSENILQQTSGNSLGSFSLRAAAGLARRPWLSSLLPSRAALLRAPQIQHVILEDWLLENVPKC
ncbi:MAG: hypothetical protein ABGX16_18595 [Pirellulales bacterium]